MVINKLYHLKREAEKQFKVRGVYGTICQLMIYLLQCIKDIASSRRKYLNNIKKYDSDFDLKYGVDTSGNIRLSGLDITNKNWIYGVRYQAIWPVDFEQILEDLKLPYQQFVFIDYGSGKGRAVLMAAALPFKKINGIEFSKKLVTIARSNLNHFPEVEKKCKDIEFICNDAIDYCLPNEPLVLYFFNPFEEPVMSKVIDNVITSYQKTPRQIIIIYFVPKCDHLWEKLEFLIKVKDLSDLSVYMAKFGCHSIEP